MQILFALFLIFAILSLWISIIEVLIIVWGAVRFHFAELRSPLTLHEATPYPLPSVTVMVPANNEERVLAVTLHHILQLNYPPHRLQLIIINDNSSDGTQQIIDHFIQLYQHRDITSVHIMDATIGGGKAKALNFALPYVTGDYLAIYDADAIPERQAVLLLVQKICASPTYGAVFGRNKMRNHTRNWLTRQINLELIVSQRVIHAGKWQLFNIGQIPGTNFLVRTALLTTIGGWDEHALTEDTDLGMEIMRRGYVIALESRSEAFQQEPERLHVYIKQRTRWAKGNIYVVSKNMKRLFSKQNKTLQLETFYYFSTYFWFLLAILLSDLIFIIAFVFWLLSFFHIHIQLPIALSREVYITFVYSWGLMYTLYVLQINLALVTDYGQSTKRNFIYSVIAYFTYAQLFIYTSILAQGSYLLDRLFHRKEKWYKTERF